MHPAVLQGTPCLKGQNNIFIIYVLTYHDMKIILSQSKFHFRNTCLSKWKETCVLSQNILNIYGNNCVAQGL